MAKQENRYSEWLKHCTFENCKLGHGPYGEFLKNYIVGEHEGFVLNLNGKWGTGKTEFLKRFYSLLSNDNYPVVYIDAWESDFSSKPLSVVSSELLIQISTLNESVGDELASVGEVLGKLMRGVFIGSAGYVSKKLTGEASYGSDLAKELLNQTPSEVIDNVKNEHAEQVAAIKDIRSQLAQLAEVLKQNAGCKLPVVVLIDELDRCRPNYSIEMLEVVKHFFSTKNFVFIIATDTEQLKESIKSVYGSGFDASTYLKRFFHREAKLAEPSLEKYVLTFDLKINKYLDGIDFYPSASDKADESAKIYIIWISTAFNLTLRDVDQLISKFSACIRTIYSNFRATGQIQLVNCFSLIAALVEFDLGLEQFELRRNSNSEHGQSMGYQDFTVETVHNTKFSEVYRLNMFCSVLHSIRNDIPHGFGAERIDVYGTHSKAGAPIDKRKGYLIGRQFDRLSEMFNKSINKEKFRLYMWNDLKAIVKLSGGIV